MTRPVVTPVRVAAALLTAACAANAVADEFGVSGRIIVQAVGSTPESRSTPLSRGAISSDAVTSSWSSSVGGSPTSVSGTAAASGFADIGVYRAYLSAQSESYLPNGNYYVPTLAYMDGAWFDHWSFSVPDGACVLGCEGRIQGHLSGSLVRGVSNQSNSAAPTSFFSAEHSFGMASRGDPLAVDFDFGEVDVVAADAYGMGSYSDGMGPIADPSFVTPATFDVPWSFDFTVFATGQVLVSSYFRAEAAFAMDANLLNSATLDAVFLDPRVTLISASGALTERAPGYYVYAAVPEPSTLMQLSGGLMLLGLAVRRRRLITTA